MKDWIKNISLKLLGEELDTKLKDYLMKGAFWSFLLQLTLAGLTFLTSIIVAWITGEEGFGKYSLVYSWITLLSFVAVWGLDDLLLKQIPIYQSDENKPALRGVIRWSYLWGTGASILIVAAFAAFVNLTEGNRFADIAAYYNWALLSIPFFVWMHVGQATSRGFKQMGVGQVGEKLVQPLSFIIGLLLCYCIVGTVSDIEAIGIRALSFGVAALAAFYLLRRYALPEFRTSKTEYVTTRWRKSTWYYMITTVLYAAHLRIDVVFLGLLDTSYATIAHYNVAQKFSDLFIMPFTIVCTITTPLFAKLYYQKDFKKLQHLFTRTTQIVTILLFLGLIFCGFFGAWLLSWYGEGYKDGYSYLMILMVAKCLHAFFGPINYLLMMADQERNVSIVLLLSVLCTVGLHVYLIPFYGALGAAYASLFGAIIFECIIAILVYRKANIMPTALGKMLLKCLKSINNR